METPHTGYRVQSYSQPVKRYCQTLNLKENPELIAEYRKRHLKENTWPEILAGIREVGILEMEIYILGSRLFMIVETPLDFDWDEAMQRLNTLPRQQEWEDYMSIFQQAKHAAVAPLMDFFLHGEETFDAHCRQAVTGFLFVIETDIGGKPGFHV